MEEIQSYIDEVVDERKMLFKKLQAMIMRLYPNAQARLSYKIPTYKVESGWVALGYWKGGVSVYTNNPSHIALFKAKHPEVKIGKASINFKITDEIPYETLVKVVEHAMENLNEI
ncbi:MAG: DUF1801 domain-containing protein [Candidatus Thorarchaeota archaeon]